MEIFIGFTFWAFIPQKVNIQAISWISESEKVSYAYILLVFDFILASTDSLIESIFQRFSLISSKKIIFLKCYLNFEFANWIKTFWKKF